MKLSHWLALCLCCALVARVRAAETNAVPEDDDGILRGKAAYLHAVIWPRGGITNWLERPLPALRAAATRGDADAQLALARRVLDGRDRDAHLAEAEKLVASAAEKNQAQAFYVMGWLEENQWPVGGGAIVANYEVAREWFEKAAAAGSARAAFELGQIYNYGKLERDYALAVKWLKQADELGHRQAAAVLGELYQANHEDKNGIFQANLQESEKWLRRAATLGDEDAARQADHIRALGPQKRGMDLTLMLEKMEDSTLRELARSTPDRAFALQVRQELAKREAASGTNGAGHNGTGGAIPSAGPRRPGEEKVPALDKMDDAALVELERKEPNLWAAVEHERAVRAVAALRKGAGRTGPGGPPPTMLPGFVGRRPSAMPGGVGPDGDPAAMLAQAETLWRNPSQEADRTNAVTWFTRAAQAGNAEAKFRLGQLWAEGATGAPDLTEAARWYRRAARQGFGPAQLALGRACLKGEGVEADAVEAVVWLKLAATQLPEPPAELAPAETALTPDQRTSVQARIEKFRAR